MEDFQSKYTGEQVEEILDQIANGEIGGGGTTTETDPIFSASAAAGITASDIAGWDNKVDKVDGKGLSTEDFTAALKQKLEGLSNYDDTELSDVISTLRGDFDKLVSGDTTTAIKTFNEVIAFLDGIQDSQDLSSIIASIEQQIAGKMDKVTLATVATSGSYNDLLNKPTIPSEQVNADWNATSGKAKILNKPTIPSAVTESTVSGWGFTKNTGTYSKPSTGIPKSDLASTVQTSLDKAETALQSYTEQYKGTVTGVKVNGSTKSPDADGLVDLGTIEGGSTGGGGVYITPFTVQQFCSGWVELTDEQRNELINAASQNRIIGMSYEDEAGYIVADFKFEYNSDYDFWYLGLGVIYNGAHYFSYIGSNNTNKFQPSRYTITPFIPLINTVAVEDGVADVADNHSFTDNCIFIVDGECTELYIYLEPSEIGKTVRFFTGESCTLWFAYPVYWANGEVPTIEPYTHYELSLVVNMEGVFNAVLTPFKPVE